MKKFSFIIELCFVMLFSEFSLLLGSGNNSLITTSLSEDTLCTPNPSPEAVALYRYLLDMHEKQTLTGTMWVPWGINEVDYVYSITGKYPAIAGFDFINQSDNKNEIKKAREYWNAGGIPTIMWHWGAPSIGEGYNASQTYIDIDSCFIEGTDQYNDFWFELDRKADLLEVLRDSGVPVIWRPYHELDGGWFWWSMEGPEKFKLLWITMFNYFVHDRGLNNLIWTLCYTANLRPAWYPGDQYVDIIGPDSYEGGTDVHLIMFNNTKLIIPERNIPICYHECGTPPNPDQCLNEEAFWSWWMVWHTGHIQSVDSNYLDYVYHHEMNITRDELPDIMEAYGWDPDSCSASIITPQIIIGEGEWQQTNKIPINTDDTVTLSPVVSDIGTWNWTGYGTSGSLIEQKVIIDTVGVATAIFTNNCGATSTAAFHFVDTCFATEIEPRVKVGDTDWKTASMFSVYKGTTVILGPLPDEEGSWIWSGCVTGTSREITFIPDVTCTAKVTYTNECGKTSEKTFKITVKKVNDTEIKQSEPEILLFPIPCKEFLNVVLPQSINNTFVINIYSIQGILLRKEIVSKKNFLLDVSYLNPGIYILQLVTDGYSATERFTKLKN
jgi:hypothetical protein